MTITGPGSPWPVPILKIDDGVITAILELESAVG